MSKGPWKKKADKAIKKAVKVMSARGKKIAASRKRNKKARELAAMENTGTAEAASPRDIELECRNAFNAGFSDGIERARIAFKLLAPFRD